MGFDWAHGRQRQHVSRRDTVCEVSSEPHPGLHPRLSYCALSFPGRGFRRAPPGCRSRRSPRWRRSAALRSWRRSRPCANPPPPPAAKPPRASVRLSPSPAVGWWRDSECSRIPWTPSSDHTQLTGRHGRVHAGCAKGVMNAALCRCRRGSGRGSRYG